MVSLIPELLRHIDDVGSPNIDNYEWKWNSENSELEDLPTKKELYNCGFPLRVFGKVNMIINIKGGFFQPYIPLQQLDVLLCKDTKSFLVGTTNSIFTTYKACAIDIIVNADSGEVDIASSALSQILSLTSADKKFMEEIKKSVQSSWISDGILT